MPATPPGNDPRDEWSRGPAAGAGHGYGYGTDRDGYPVDYRQPDARGYGEPPPEYGQPEYGYGQQPDPRGYGQEPDPRGYGQEPDPRGYGQQPGYDEPPPEYGYGWGQPPPAPDDPTALTPVVTDDGYDEMPPEEASESPEVPVPRMMSLAVAGLAALLTAGLVFGAMITHGSYAVVIFGVQVLYVFVWTVATRPPAPRIVAGVGLAAAAAADLATVLVDPASLAPLAYVTAGAFVAGVVGQLTRPAGRVRVTESLASTLAVVVGVVALSTLVVLSREPRGTQSIVACLLAAGVAVTVARLTDTVAPVPRLAPQVPRGGLGVVLGAMAGTGVAALAGAVVDGLTIGPAAAAGLVTALVAVVVDLSIGYAEAGRHLAGEVPALWLARHIQGPLAAFALAAPAAFAASALLLLNYL